MGGRLCAEIEGVVKSRGFGWRGDAVVVVVLEGILQRGTWEEKEKERGELADEPSKVSYAMPFVEYEGL